MKAKISFGIEDLAHLFGEADEAIKVLVGLVQEDCLEKMEPKSWEEGQVFCARSLVKEIVDHKVDQFLLTELTAQLSFGDRAADAIHSLIACRAVKYYYDMKSDKAQDFINRSDHFASHGD